MPPQLYAAVRRGEEEAATVNKNVFLDGPIRLYIFSHMISSPKAEIECAFPTSLLSFLLPSTFAYDVFSLSC